MANQPTGQVVPPPNEKLPDVRPVEQQTHGDAPAGGQPVETSDLFRADLDRGANPRIDIADRSNLTVKEAEFRGANGEVVKGSTYTQGRAQYFMSETGDKYRMIQQKNGETSFHPVGGNANRRPLADVPATATHQQTGEQVPVRRSSTVEPVSDASTTGNRRSQVTVEGETVRRPTVDRVTQQVATATGAIDGNFTQKERNALRSVMDRDEYADASRRIAKLPEGQQAAAWQEVQAGVKRNLDGGAQVGSSGLLDRQALERRITNPEAPVVKAEPRPAVVDGKPAVVEPRPEGERPRRGERVEPAVVEPRPEGERPRRGERIEPAVVPGGQQQQQQQFSERQQQALARYQELANGGNRDAINAAYKDLRREFGQDSAREIRDRVREGQPVAVSDLQGRIRQDFNPPGKDNPGGNPREFKIQPQDGQDRGGRPTPEQVAARQAQIQQQIQDAVREHGRDGRDGRDGPGGRRQDGEGRDIKLPGDQNQRGQIDLRQAMDLARQPKDQPFPPGLENKLKNNPEALAALQQSWKEARDRDGKPGDLTMRGRQDGGDQSHGLDAIKGGPNQKGIPGFDLNDKATREFLADAMKRLEQSKGQRIDDIFKGLDPAKADRLTKFLTEGSADGKFNPARVKDLMGLSDQLKNPTERLYDFLKANKDLINNQQMSAKDTQKLLADLSKTLGDVNKQLGLDGTNNALRMEDILGRKLDPTRPGERLAAMQENGINRQMSDRADAMALIARTTPAQEMAIRQMLDLRAGKDPVVQPVAKNTAQEGQQAGRETAPGARFEGPQTRLDGAQAAAQNAARMDAASARPDVTVKADTRDGKPESTTAKPEGPQAQRQQDIALGTKQPVDAKIDKAGDGLSTTDRKDEKFLEEKAKRDKKEEEEKEKREKEEQHKREEKTRLDALMLAALAEKKRKQMEQEQKEKEKSDEKDKQRDREKRRRYIVREKDTLQSIATTQLRDVKLSPLIYEINKEVIQLRVENGKQVPDLKPKMIIWLPSTTEIEEFRKGGISGAREAGTQDKKMSADDELIARFGAGWSGGAKTGQTAGPATGGPPTIPGSQPATSSEVTAALAASAMEAAQKKRANIESLLGPIGRAKPVDGRIKYIARLGDSLKSIAMKHPGLQDVNLWKLVAEVNGLSTETDSRGTPLATLSRGVELLIPSNVDVQNFRARSCAPQAVLTTGGVKSSGVITEVATKLCEGCGRMTVNSATICPACGRAFGASNDDEDVIGDNSHDTNTRRELPQNGDRTVIQSVSEEAPEDAKTVFVAPQEADEDAPTRITSGNHSMHGLNDECRMLLCDGQGIICQLEVLRAGAWAPVVSYEIYDDVALRNEHTPDGRKRTVRIDLPPTAARELAHNDLFSNWKQYCSRAVGHQID